MELITCFIRITSQSTFVSYVVFGSRHIGIVTTTDHLVEYDNGLIKLNLYLTINGHTTPVATTEDRTEISGVRFIGIGGPVLTVEYDTGHDVHIHTFHVAVEGGLTISICLTTFQLQGTEGRIGITLQDVLIHHHFTIVAQEHLVGYDIRSNLQLGFRIRIGIIIMKRCTVTTAIDSSTDNGGVVLVAHQTHRHRLGIGAESIQNLYRILSFCDWIIEVTIDIIALKIWVVRIRIGTVTTAVDITTDAAVDTHSIAALHIARDIVTAIHIVDITSENRNTGCITARYINALDGFCWYGVNRRYHIGHTASTIHVVDHKLRSVDAQEDTIRMGHIAPITTAVKVAHLTPHKLPCRTDSHRCLVVATKQATYLESITAGIRETRVDTHLLLEAVFGQQLTAVCIFNAVDHLTGVVDTDDGLFRHGSIVTTTVGIDDGTTQNLQIGFLQVWLRQSTFFIVLLTITTSKELTDINLLSVSGLFHRCIRLFASRCRLRRYTHKGVPRTVNLIFCCTFQLRRNSKSLIVGSYLSCYIVTAIHIVDDDIVRGVFAINMNKRVLGNVSNTCSTIDLVDVASPHGNRRAATDISLVTTAINTTANNYLGLHRRGSEEHHQTYYGRFNSQLLTINF